MIKRPLESPNGKGKNSQIAVLVGILLVLAVAAVYWQTLTFGLTNYDDNLYITENPHVQAGLTADGVRWAFTTGYECFYQPMVWVSYMLDKQIHGQNAGGYHVTNVLLHAVSALLLFWLLFRMSGYVWRSGFVAALFAIHPLHVESVAWVAERKDVLSGLFWMLACLAYVQYTERPRLARYVLLTLLYTLGLMAKPMLVTLPIALLMLDYWPLRRFERLAGEGKGSAYAWRVLIREKTPLIVLTGAFSIVAFVLERTGGAVSSLQQVPMGVRLSNAAVSYVQYVIQMFWPTRLAAMYPHPRNTLPLWQVVASWAALGTLSLLIFIRRQLPKYILVGWAWFLVTMLPVIGLIPIGAHARADRFTYIPLIGLFIIIAWGLPDLLSTRHDGKRKDGSTVKTTVLSLAAVVSIGVLIVLSRVQAGYWKNGITLFEHALDVTSDNYVAENQIGSELHMRGDRTGAISHYQAALRINPRYVGAQANLATALLETGRVREAIPMYAELLKATPSDSVTRVNLGRALQQEGRLDAAMRMYKEAMRITPDYTPAYGNLGNAYMSRKEYANAIEQYSHILRLDPTDLEAHTNLAVAYYCVGDYARSWDQVHQCRNRGGDVAPGFLKALSDKMSDPGE